MAKKKVAKKEAPENNINLRLVVKSPRCMKERLEVMRQIAAAVKSGNDTIYEAIERLGFQPGRITLGGEGATTINGNLTIESGEVDFKTVTHTVTIGSID